MVRSDQREIRGHQRDTAAQPRRSPIHTAGQELSRRRRLGAGLEDNPNTMRRKSMNEHLSCRRQAWLVAVLIIGFVVAVCASTLAAPPDLQSGKNIQILQETNLVDVYDY